MTQKRKSMTNIYANILKNGGSVSDLPIEKTPTLAELLNGHLGRTGKPIKTVAELAGLNNASMHKILGGEMRPSRNTLLRLSLVMELSFEDTQALLKAGNRSMLSGSRNRDLIIMEGIIQRQGLGSVNAALTRQGFGDLFSKQD